MEKIKSAKEILSSNTQEHYVLNSNIYTAEVDILKSMEQYAFQFTPKWVSVDNPPSNYCECLIHNGVVWKKGSYSNIGFYADNFSGAKYYMLIPGI